MSNTKNRQNTTATKSKQKKQTSSTPKAAVPKAVLTWEIGAREGRKAVSYDPAKVSLPYVTADEVEQYITRAVKELQRISSQRVHEQALAKTKSEDKVEMPEIPFDLIKEGPAANSDKPQAKPEGQADL